MADLYEPGPENHAHELENPCRKQKKDGSFFEYLLQPLIRLSPTALQIGETWPNKSGYAQYQLKC